MNPSTYVFIENDNDNTNDLIVSSLLFVSFLLFVHCFYDRKSIQDTCTYNSTDLLLWNVVRTVHVLCANECSCMYRLL